jgi:RimJ/RimL family protein N-acetyltransferase
LTDRTPPIIRGESVYLRPAERSDIPIFVRWFNDAEVIHELAQRAPMSLAMEEGWFDRMVAAQGKTDYHFVICLRADDRPIGTIGLHDLDFVNGTAEFGIVIGEKEAQNRGYGTDALRALCDFGFGELRLERIGCEVYDGNDRAQRAYQKAGFTREGTWRRGHFSRGTYIDVHLMGLLRTEWAADPRPKSWERD